MVVDDVDADSQQILKEEPHRHNNKPNVNDARETLLQSMTKNVDEDSEMLEATKDELEKATLVAAMESKVSMVVTTIRSKIDIGHC